MQLDDLCGSLEDEIAALRIHTASNTTRTLIAHTIGSGECLPRETTVRQLASFCYGNSERLRSPCAPMEPRIGGEARPAKLLEGAGFWATGVSAPLP